MLQILNLVILIVGALFLGLIVFIVTNKMRREAVESHARSRRRVLEPRVLAFAHGDAESLARWLGVEVVRRDRRVLEAILLDHAQLVRGIERERLATALDELGFVDQHIAALAHDRWWCRAEAAEKLGLAAARRAGEQLSAALDDPVAEVRMRAAKALGRLGGAASTRRLIEALESPTRWSTLRIGDVLTRMGGDVVEDLIAAYPSMSVHGRAAALDVVARLRPLGTTDWLVARLDEPHADVRARACHALGSIGDPDAAGSLIAALGDADWPVRAQAAKALGRMRIDAAAASLCRGMRDRRWWVRSNAADALKSLGSGGEEALVTMLGDADRFARQQAALKLEELGAVDRRVEQLTHADDARRAEAETVLREMIATGRTGRLRALAQAHRDATVRRALKTLLPTADEAA